MRILILAIFIITSTASANDFVPRLTKVKIKEIEYEVSDNCKTNKCMAIKSLHNLNQKNFEKISSHIFGGKQPGLVVCRKLFKGKMKFYKDSEGNEYVYCFFKDESYISTTQYDLIISYFD